VVAALKPQPGPGCADLTMLPEGQAVARLDYTVYDGWYLAFVDTPGDGLYLGYIHEGSVQPIEALSLTGAGAAVGGVDASAMPAPTLSPQPAVLTSEEDRAERAPTLSQTVDAAQQPAAPAVTPDPPPPVPLPPLFPSPPPAVTPPLIALPPGKLSAHFTLDEFIRSAKATADRMGDAPPAEIIEGSKSPQSGWSRSASFSAARRSISAVAIAILYSTRRSAARTRATTCQATLWILPVRRSARRIRSAAPFAISGLMVHVDQLIHEKLRWVHISFDPQCRKQLLSFFDSPDGTTARMPGILARGFA